MSVGLEKSVLEKAKEVRKAWEWFVTGDDRGLEKIRPEIRASWFRSRQAKVNPTLRRISTILEPEELQRQCQQNTYLLEAGRQTVAFLDQALTSETFVIVITNGRGNFLYTYSPPNRADKRETINAFPGASVQENEVGTTCLATTLYTNKPIQVQWYESYAEFAHRWSGCAAPIHDPCGKIVGALAVAGYREAAHPRALDLVISAASLIESRIQQIEKLAHFEVLNQFNRYLLNFPESPLLALSPHGRILALSPALAKLMPTQSADHLVGRFLNDVQDFRYEESGSPANLHSSESYESFLVFPHKEKTYSSTAFPIHSQEEERAGLVILASSPRQGTRKRISKPLWQATYTFHDLAGRAPAFSRAIQMAEKAAVHDCPVLLEGESGTGKELFAHAIHRASEHGQGPFVALNLSMIPKEIVAAELFGHEEGAFSGARRGGSRGKIELAHQGTLFLDELGDMPIEIQSGFLRFLEEQKIVPLGSEHPRVVDVRVIAATNVDLKRAITQGKFRLDLYHRLNLFPIILPPLRERLEDLPILVLSLLDQEGFADVQVSAEVIDIFCHYAWPGNIRELRNILVRGAILSENRKITPKDLPPELLSYNPFGSHPEAASHRLEREQIQQALQMCGGHISRTAQYLGVHRVTLHRWLRAYGLTREEMTRPGAEQEITSRSQSF